MNDIPAEWRLTELQIDMACFYDRWEEMRHAMLEEVARAAEDNLTGHYASEADQLVKDRDDNWASWQDEQAKVAELKKELHDAQELSELWCLEAIEVKRAGKELQEQLDATEAELRRSEWRVQERAMERDSAKESQLELITDFEYARKERDAAQKRLADAKWYIEFADNHDAWLKERDSALERERVLREVLSQIVLPSREFVESWGQKDLVVTMEITTTALRLGLEAYDAAIAAIAATEPSDD